LAARDADMKDADTQCNEESYSIPLGEPDPEESTTDCNEL